MIILRKLRALAIIFHGALMSATFAVSYAYFAERLGLQIDVEVPDVLYTVVGLGVLGVSVVSAILHVLGGGVMGATAGGFISGMRFGFLLGAAYGLGRLWLYAGSALGASVLFWPENKTYSIMLAVATILCFIMQMGTKFVWGKLRTQ